MIMLLFPKPSLKDQLGSKLNLPRCSGGLVNLSCAVDPQSVIVYRSLEIGVIEDVEELRTELRVKSAHAQLHILEYGKVDIQQSRDRSASSSRYCPAQVLHW